MCTVADALEMDFLPLFVESCDLIVLEVFYNHQLSEPLCSVIKGDEFKKALDALTGYDTKILRKTIAVVK